MKNLVVLLLPVLLVGCAGGGLRPAVVANADRIERVVKVVVADNNRIKRLEDVVQHLMDGLVEGGLVKFSYPSDKPESEPKAEVEPKP